MRIKLAGVVGSAALALIFLSVSGPARADGKSAIADGCGDALRGCARIRGYVAAGADATPAVKPFALPTPPGLRSPATAPAPRPSPYGFDGRFLIDVSHDSGFR